MSDPVSANLSLNVVEGASSLIGGMFRKFKKSGLSIRFHGGRVGAVGLADFDRDPSQMTTDWSFVLKIVNPNSHPIAVEEIIAQWKGGLTFFAETTWSTIKMVYPKPTLPDNGDESLPRLIEAGATQLIKVESMMFLYKKWVVWKRSTHYTKDNYIYHPKNLRFVVKIRTNQGRTILKS